MQRNQMKQALQEAYTTRSLINRISKCHATFFGHEMRRGKLKYLITSGIIEGKCSRGKMLDGPTKWLKVGRVTEALKVTKDKDAWKVMIGPR